MKYTILICDDEAEARNMLSFVMTDKGYRIIESENISSAMTVLQAEKVDILITDLLIGDENGIELIKKMKKSGFTMPVIFLTAYGTIESAVQAMTEGAFYYLLKPLHFEELLAILKRAEEKIELERQNVYLNEEVSKLRDVSHSMVAVSPVMQNLMAEVKKIALTDSTVLILGESGTGKEVVANVIHRESTRSARPFVVVNCAAISEHLLESELFGHERGAFTGAVKTKAGKFEVADGGTIFLDEIGELPQNLQSKLLRVLENGEVDRVGSVDKTFVDVRVVAATNRDLKKAVEQGAFRSDLYYRLTVLPVKIPPLRERPGAVRALAEHFLALNESARGKKVTVDESVYAAFEAYPWPGNVRELKNLIERLTILHDHIACETLPDEFSKPCAENASASGELPLAGRSIKSIEKEAIRQALILCKGNKRKAADTLEITRQTLYAKMKEYSIHAVLCLTFILYSHILA
ncbi:MAG: sigma-54 dependent transcriptional regulator [Spirochaetota bacterium]